MSKRVMIVDDEPRFTASLQTYFEAKGFRVQTSLNGKEAICKFRKSPVNVIITDIQMPRQDGFDFTGELIREDRLAQVIFLTGYPSLDHVKKAFKLKAFDFFKKPVESLDLLVNAVESAQLKYDRLKGQMETRQKIREKTAAYGHIFNSLDIAIVVLDMANCEIIFSNSRFNLEMGYEKTGNLAGKKCWKVIHGNSTGQCRFCTNARLLDNQGKPSESFEWEFENKQTQRRYLIVDKAIEWVDQRLVRLSIFYDITEKRKSDIQFRSYEKKIQHLNQLEHIKTLAGGIAHQFNNSLSVISGNLELMEMDLDPYQDQSERVNHYTQAMKVSTDKMVKLTSSLLAYARGGRYRTQPVLFHELVDEVLRSVEEETDGRLTIINHVAETDHIVRVDKVQISTLMANILENSMEAGAERIEITGGKSGHGSPDPEAEGSWPGRQYLCLKMEDNGQGMDKEILDRVFQPFFTTKFQGRGLGLAAALGIVKSHMGFIYMDSDTDRGAIVSIYFPLAESMN